MSPAAVLFYGPEAFPFFLVGPEDFKGGPQWMKTEWVISSFRLGAMTRPKENSALGKHEGTMDSEHKCVQTNSGDTQKVPQFQQNVMQQAVSKAYII